MIDDDPVLSGVVREFLLEEDFGVTLCDAWQDAQALVAQTQPDLVLLDLRFGNAECGWHILDTLEVDPATRRIPVILWSAAIDSLAARAPALLPKHGIFALPKPCDLNTLLSTIFEALTGRASGSDGSIAPPTIDTEV